MKKKLIDFDIYPVITEEFCKNGSSIKTLKEVIKAGVKIVQLREKVTDKKTKRDILKLAFEFRKITKKKKVLLIINDHIDIALAVNADGVHLGPEDIPVDIAKKIAPDLIIGASAYSIKEAVNLQKKKVDYVNIGSIFATSTKKLKTPPIGLEGIKKTKKCLKIPFTVIGGIKEENLSEVVKAGARRVAMITEITQSDNIIEKIKRLRRIVEENFKNDIKK